MAQDERISGLDDQPAAPQGTSAALGREGIPGWRRGVSVRGRSSQLRGRGGPGRPAIPRTAQTTGREISVGQEPPAEHGDRPTRGYGSQMRCRGGPGRPAIPPVAPPRRGSLQNRGRGGPGIPVVRGDQISAHGDDPIAAAVSNGASSSTDTPASLNAVDQALQPGPLTMIRPFSLATPLAPQKRPLSMEVVTPVKRANLDAGCELGRGSTVSSPDMLMIVRQDDDSPYFLDADFAVVPDETFEFEERPVSRSGVICSDDDGLKASSFVAGSANDPVILTDDKPPSSEELRRVERREREKESRLGEVRRTKNRLESSRSTNPFSMLTLEMIDTYLEQDRAHEGSLLFPAPNPHGLVAMDLKEWLSFEYSDSTDSWWDENTIANVVRLQAPTRGHFESPDLLYKWTSSSMSQDQLMANIMKDLEQVQAGTPIGFEFPAQGMSPSAGFLVFPMNQNNNHWFAVMMEPSGDAYAPGRITVFDSMSKSCNPHPNFKFLDSFLPLLARLICLRDDLSDRWRLCELWEVSIGRCFQQSNFFDCGPLTAFHCTNLLQLGNVLAQGPPDVQHLRMDTMKALRDEFRGLESAPVSTCIPRVLLTSATDGSIPPPFETSPLSEPAASIPHYMSHVTLREELCNALLLRPLQTTSEIVAAIQQCAHPHLAALAAPDLIEAVLDEGLKSNMFRKGPTRQGTKGKVWNVQSGTGRSVDTPQKIRVLSWRLQNSGFDLISAGREVKWQLSISIVRRSGSQSRHQVKEQTQYRARDLMRNIWTHLYGSESSMPDEIVYARDAQDEALFSRSHWTRLSLDGVSSLDALSTSMLAKKTELYNLFRRINDHAYDRGERFAVLIVGTGWDGTTTQNSEWMSLMEQHPNIDFSVALLVPSAKLQDEARTTSWVYYSVASLVEQLGGNAASTDEALHHEHFLHVSQILSQYKADCRLCRRFAALWPAMKKDPFAFAMRGRNKLKLPSVEEVQAEADDAADVTNDDMTAILDNITLAARDATELV